MGDFYQNLNKGIEQIVPLAMKKFELDSDAAKAAAQLQHIEGQNALLGEQVEGLRRKRETETALRVKLQEMVGKGVPGTETVNLRDLLPAGQGGDVDQGFSTTGQAPMVQQERQVMRKPTAEDLVMGTLEFSDPAHALTALTGLSKADTNAEALKERVAMQIQNSKEISDAKLKMAEIIANLNNSGRRDVALLRALNKGSENKDDKIANYFKIADRLAGLTKDGQELSATDQLTLKDAAQKIGYNLIKTPGGKYHREILGMSIPGTSGEEAATWALVPAGSNLPAFDIALDDGDNPEDVARQIVSKKRSVTGKTGGAKPGKYASADDVKTAYQAGKLDKNQASAILRSQFGYE